MKGSLFYLALLGAALLLIASSPAVAQLTVNPTIWTGMTGSFTDSSNWDTGFEPNANFDDIAIVNNGGTVFVDDTPDPGPGGVIVAQGNGDSGTLEIRSGGVLNVPMDASGLGLTNGQVVVGEGGAGHLRVLPGGTLNAATLSSGGAASSSIVLGEMGGSGTATVNIEGAATLNRNTRVIGPNVDFTADTLRLGSEHLLTAEITGADHSPLKANSAALAGDLHIEFSGHTPSLGDTWNLVDAASISGNISSVTTNASLDPGLNLFLNTQPGGMNGNVAQLAVDVQLVLTVNQRTGAASIRNLAPEGSVDLDGYAIVSPEGALNPDGWTSFADAGQADWSEANPGAAHLTELSLGGSRTIEPNSSIELGTPYAFTPAAIGETASDIAFQYTSARGTFDGVVEFTGPENNLVLIVDPATGEGALQNQSPFDISLDGYAILSNSASLNPESWMSLEDGGETGWAEANATENHLTELNLTDGTMLAAGGSLLSLGSLFDADDPAAEQDLALDFTLSTGKVLAGVVQYGEIPGMMPPPMGIVGDYNDNGQVEQADLSLVLLNWGSDAVPDGWVNDLPDGTIDQAELSDVLLNWGNTAAAGLATGAVPEPTSALLALGALVAFCVQRRLTRRSRR